jgi:receptor expression-enhancing protein 1/2/3/4
MFFSTIADLLTLLATTLFPLFASYKALKSPSPITLAPWLTFYATITTVYLLESTILYPLSYVPFYSWFRLFFHLYLLLPAPEGAARLYNDYLEPLITHHEADIENFIVQTHSQLKSSGLQYVKMAIEWFRVNVLNQEPAPPPPPASTSGTYMQSLLSRFYGAPATTPAPTSDMFGSAVSSVMQWAGTGGLGKHKVVIPPQYNQTPADRLAYLRKNIDNLGILMQAFSREESKIVSEDTVLSKSRSEPEFDRIERDEIGPDHEAKKAASGGGSWISPWLWRSAPDSAAMSKKIDPEEDVHHDSPHSGKSSGIEL